MRIPVRVLTFVLALPLAAGSISARVSDEEFLRRRGLDEKWKISLGGYVKRFDTTVRFEAPDLGLGGAINLEDIFGLDTERTDVILEGRGPHMGPIRSLIRTGEA